MYDVANGLMRETNGILKPKLQQRVWETEKEIEQTGSQYQVRIDF